MVAALLGVTGCSGGVPPTVPPSVPVALAEPGVAPADVGSGAPIERAEVVAFSAELDTALQSGDVEQWLDLFALADEADVQHQRDWFAAVHAVPMDLREIHPVHIRWPTSAAPDGPRVDLALRHQVRGADPEPAVELYRAHLGRRDGQVRIVGIGGADSVRSGYPQLWDLEPVEVLEGEVVLVLTQRDRVPEAEELLPALDRAASEVLADFPVPGVSRMVVTLTDGDAFEELVTVRGSGFAGITEQLPTAPEVRTAGDGGLSSLPEGAGTAVRLHLGAEYTATEWALYDDEADGGSPLMRHEGVHLAMALTEPAGAPPSWAAEGFAGWYEVAPDEVLREQHLWWLDKVSGDASVEGLPPALPWSFYTDDTELLDRNYAESAAVFRYVEDTFGWDTTVALGADLHALEWYTDDIGPLLEGHLGLTPEEFEQGYLDWLAAALP